VAVFYFNAMRILKTDQAHQTATFVVLEPETVDRNGDLIHEDDIIKTAHEFVRNLHEKYVNVNHQPDTKLQDVEFVESFVLPEDLVISNSAIKKGSWLVGFHFLSTELWDQVLSGEIVGVSMEGT